MLQCTTPGITVTKELSATTRAVLDQIRVILIWAVFLIPWGPFLCAVQDYFHWTAVWHLLFVLFVIIHVSHVAHRSVYPYLWSLDLQWRYYYASDQKVHSQDGHIWFYKRRRDIFTKGVKLSKSFVMSYRNKYCNCYVSFIILMMRFGDVGSLPWLMLKKWYMITILIMKFNKPWSSYETIWELNGPESWNHFQL